MILQSSYVCTSRQNRSWILPSVSVFHKPRLVDKRAVRANPKRMYEAIGRDTHYWFDLGLDRCTVARPIHSGPASLVTGVGRSFDVHISSICPSEYPVFHGCLQPGCGLPAKSSCGIPRYLGRPTTESREYLADIMQMLGYLQLIIAATVCNTPHIYHNVTKRPR